MQLQTTAVVGVLSDAYASAEETFGIRAAQAFGADFPTWPMEVRMRDGQSMEQYGMSFQAMCQAHQASRAEGRFSLARLRRCVHQSDPDFERAARLTEGIRMSLPADFSPSATPPPMRRKYKLGVANAVNKLLYKQWCSGTVLIIPT